MAVKDLVELFSAHPGPSSPTALVSAHLAPPSRRASQPAQFLAQGSASSPRAPTEPERMRQARFVKHPLLQDILSRPETATSGLPNLSTVTTRDADATTIHDPFDDINVLPDSTGDITDEHTCPAPSLHLSPSHSAPHISPLKIPPMHTRLLDSASERKGPGSRMKQWLSSVGDTEEDPDERSEHAMLLSEVNQSSCTSKSAKYTSPRLARPLIPSIASSSTAFRAGSPSRASTSTLAAVHYHIPHTPIPLTTILARDAAPLYLPKLDAYIASLLPPSFSHMPCMPKGEEKEVAMFPPMDTLAATGKSIEDLETNSTVPPWWRNGKGILGTINNAVLGLTVRYSYMKSMPLFSLCHRGPAFLRPTTA